MYARNTNCQPHPGAACRVGWLTLVPGGRVRPGGRSLSRRMCRAWVRHSVIAPGWEYSGGD